MQLMSSEGEKNLLKEKQVGARQLLKEMYRFKAGTWIKDKKKQYQITKAFLAVRHGGCHIGSVPGLPAFYRAHFPEEAAGVVDPVSYGHRTFATLTGQDDLLQVDPL